MHSLGADGIVDCQLMVCVSQHKRTFAEHELCPLPVVSLDDILKALSLHEIHGGLHAVQQRQDRRVGCLPILVGLDHVFQVIVHTLQLGSLAGLQCLHMQHTICYGTQLSAGLQ